MTELKVFEFKNTLVVDSRDVAHVVGRPHNDLLKSIRQYCEYLTEGDFPLSDFFVLSTYTDSTGRPLPCYLVTRKGCDMVANKMTGEKGVLFTAAYVTKFHEMEQAQKPACMEDILIYQLQEMKALKQQVHDVGERVDDIKKVVALNPNDWRKESSDIIKNIAFALGGSEHIKGLYQEVYALLEQRYGVSLSRRLTNMRQRLADNGVSRTKRERLNQLDVIADDKKLIEGYVAIVKELAVKHGYKPDQQTA